MRVFTVSHFLATMGRDNDKVYHLSASCPPFDKGGLGGIFKAVRLIAAREIPLNPPFPKGEADRRPDWQKVMDGKTLLYRLGYDLGLT